MENNRRNDTAFWIVVLMLSIILIGLSIVSIVLGVSSVNYRTLYRYSSPLTPAPSSPSSTPGPRTDERAMPAEESPRPILTPAPRGSYDMPELDGPSLELKGDYSGSIFYNNPLPDIFEGVSDSVVAVLNYATQSYGRRSLMTVSGSGTGFIISSEGYVLTNAHVVDKAEKVTVKLNSGIELEAVLVGADTDSDVAVLKIDYPDLKAIAIGDSSKMRVGDFVVAIGNPLSSDELVNTTTFGIISATAREITINGRTNQYLQTDAAINFGNSGGPLLNMYGEVIGMNSAKSITAGYDNYGNAVSAEGIGFALPINTVCEIMSILIDKGSVQRPAVGITVMTIDEVVSASYGLSRDTGVYVAGVIEGAPGDRAGLKAGDIIVSMEGKPIVDKDELVNYIAGLKIGDSITVGVIRGSAEEELSVTIVLSNKDGMDYDAVTTPAPTE